MVIHNCLLLVITTACVNIVLGGVGNGNGYGPLGGPPSGMPSGPAAPVNNVKDTSVSTDVPARCFPNKETGKCRAHMPKYFFNTKNGQCEKFIYGGCGGNGNRFDTLTGCHRTCTCKTEAETGPCRGHMRRWFYSAADGCCRPFIYGGCGGNSNNYETWTECSNLCGYPTTDSTFWQWGLDWLKYIWQRMNQNQNQKINKPGKPQTTLPNRYTKDDFMRDWVLWGLLTGGEGELEMEEMATMIGQAHILGFGQASGGTPGTGTANRQTYNYTMADTHAALKYFQRYFGGEAAETSYDMMGRAMAASAMVGAMGMANAGSMGGANEKAMGGANAGTMGAANAGAMGGAVNSLGPAYSVPRPGSFTPLGKMGSADNYIHLQAGMQGAGGWGGGMTGGMNQWAARQSGQYGQQYGNNQQWAYTNQNQQNQQGSMSNQQGSMSNQQGSMSNQQGSMSKQQGSVSNQQGAMSNQQGTVSNQGGWQTKQYGGQSNRQGSHSNQWGYQNSQQQAASRNSRKQSSGNAAQWQGSWVKARFQNMGNTREGWAPHLKSTPGLGTAALEMFRLIRQLSNDNLNPFAFYNLARRYGAVQGNGKVNIEQLAQRLVGSLTSSSGTAQVAGVAKSLGAVDAKGNIDFKKLMAEMKKTAGKGGLFGLNWGGKWEGRSRSGGTGFEMGGFGGRKSRRNGGRTAKSKKRSNIRNSNRNNKGNRY